MQHNKLYSKIMCDARLLHRWSRGEFYKEVELVLNMNNETLKHKNAHALMSGGGDGAEDGE